MVWIKTGFLKHLLVVVQSRQSLVEGKGPQLSLECAPIQEHREDIRQVLRAEPIGSLHEFLHGHDGPGIDEVE